MNIDDALSELKKAKKAYRSLDGTIARALGWQRKPTQIQDQTTGEVKKISLWIVPSTREAGTVPFYTTSLQDALNLADQVIPGHAGACSWEDGKGSARINDDGPVVTAPTAELALCIAILTHMKNRPDGEA